MVTTHLKARRGALLSTLRAEQGADLLQWLASVVPRPATPLVLTGDLNAPPSEAVVAGVLTRGSRLPLTSAYPLDTLGWSTWKVSRDWWRAGHVSPTLTLIGAGAGHGRGEARAGLHPPLRGLGPHPRRPRPAAPRGRGRGAAALAAVPQRPPQPRGGPRHPAASGLQPPVILRSTLSIATRDA